MRNVFLFSGKETLETDSFTTQLYEFGFNIININDVLGLYRLSLMTEKSSLIVWISPNDYLPKIMTALSELRGKIDRIVFVTESDRYGFCIRVSEFLDLSVVNPQSSVEDIIGTVVSALNSDGSYYPDGYLEKQEIYLNLGKPDFSNRELEVLELAVSGMSNAEIAYKLGIVKQTVKNHFKNMTERFGVNKRVKICVLAHFYGYI